MHADIPLTARCIGIDGDDAVFLGKLAEVSEPAHIVGVLILAMEQNHERVALLLIVALGEMQDIGARSVIDFYFLLSFLRTRRSHGEQSQDAHRKRVCLRPLKARSRFRHFRNHSCSLS